jgi:hypothetical protein
LLLGLIGSQLVVIDEHTHLFAERLNILSNQIIPHLAGDGNTRGGGASFP